MNEHEVEKMKELLRNSLPTIPDAELQRDLWPAMLRRMEQRPTHVPWWDWALLAGAAATIFLVPGIIPALLYHL
jgi:hypothetical protein